MFVRRLAIALLSSLVLIPLTALGGGSLPAIEDNSGAFTYQVPIEVPPGPGGSTPDLALMYSSAGGNGNAGMGWTLPYSSLRLDLKWGVPEYWLPTDLCDPSEFAGRLYLDGMETVPSTSDPHPAVPPGTCIFRTRPDTFALIVPIWDEGSCGGVADEVSWMPSGFAVVRQDGTAWWYGDEDGCSLDYRDVAPGADGNAVTTEWLLNIVEDRDDNTIRFHPDRDPTRFDPLSWTEPSQTSTHGGCDGCLRAVTWAEFDRSTPPEGYYGDPAPVEQDGVTVGFDYPEEYAAHAGGLTGSFADFLENPGAFWPEWRPHYYAAMIDWEDRPDVRTSFLTGGARRQDRRIRQVAIGTNAQVWRDATTGIVNIDLPEAVEWIRSYRFDYDQGTTGRSRLRRLWTFPGQYDESGVYDPALPSQGDQEWTPSDHVDNPWLVNPWEFLYSDNSVLDSETWEDNYTSGAAQLELDWVELPFDGPTNEADVAQPWLGSNWQHYGYGNAGRRTWAHYPMLGEHVYTTLDPVGRPAAMYEAKETGAWQLAPSSPGTSYVEAVSWEIRGRPLELLLGNGVQQSFDYETGSAAVGALVHAQVSGAEGKLLDRSYDWNEAGNLLSWQDEATSGNGWASPAEQFQCSYDGIGSLLGCTDRLMSSPPKVFQYAYDPAGNLVWEYASTSQGTRTASQFHRNASSLAPSFPEVPPLNAPVARVVDAVGFYGSRAQSLEYDSRGHLVVQRYHDAALASSMDAAVTQLGLVESADPSARLPSLAERHYDWDATGRLREVGARLGSTGPTDIISTYRYDAGGNRIESVFTPGMGSATSEPVRVRRFGGLVETTERVGDDGTDGTAYYRFAGMRVAQRDGSSPDDPVPWMQVHWIAGDHLGSATVITDEDGDLVRGVRYEPYGRVRQEWGPESDDLFPEDYAPGAVEDLFGGKPRSRRPFGLDGVGFELEGYDYGARLYLPELSRWASADSITPEVVWEANPFAYVRNNPLKYVDPTGQMTETALDDRAVRLSDPEGWAENRAAIYPPEQVGYLAVGLMAGGGLVVVAGPELVAAGLTAVEVADALGLAAMGVPIADAMFISSGSGATTLAVTFGSGWTLARLWDLQKQIDATMDAAALGDGLTIRSVQWLTSMTPQRHHVFPQKFRDWFKARGFDPSKGGPDIDEFTVEIAQWEHTLVHGPMEWSAEVMRLLYDAEAVKGSMLNVEEIQDVVFQAMEANKLPMVFVDFKAPRP